MGEPVAQTVILFDMSLCVTGDAHLDCVPLFF